MRLSRQVTTPTGGARSSKFRRQKSFAELYGDDSLDDSPTTPGTDVVLVRPDPDPKPNPIWQH